MMCRSIFRIFVVVFSCLAIGSLFAQKQSITDSLLKVLQTAKPDSNRVNILNDLSLRFNAIGDNNSALQYENEALALAEKINYKKGATMVYKNLGNIYINQGNYQEALKNINASLKISTEIGDKKGIASSYGNMGSVYYLQGNYPEALKNFIISLKLKEEIGDKKGIAGAFNNIANIYTQQGNYPKALEQYFSSLKIRQEIGDKKGISTCYNNIGAIYDLQGNYPAALKSHQASLKIKQETGDKNGIASSYNNIGIIYFHQGNYPAALTNYLASAKIYEETGDKQGIVNVYADLGRVLIKQASVGTTSSARQKNTEALRYLNKGLALAKEIGDKDGIKTYYQCLSEADSSQSNYAQALKHYKSYAQYKDSLLNAETNRQVAQMEIRYETEKKDREIKLLGKENQVREQQMKLLELRSRWQVTMIIAAVTVAIVLIIIVLIIINSRRRLRKTYILVNKQKEEIEVQKEEVESTLEKLKHTQSQLIQSEKMASLGMLTAGIAHEINNPVNFINSGAIGIQNDFIDLERFIHLIEQKFPDAMKLAGEHGIDELLKIMKQTIEDIKTGVTRTSEIVSGLRNFTRMDASELIETDLHEGLDSTLLLLSHTYKDKVQVVKDYDNRIGLIRCYPGPLNQVFMNLLNNAIDAINSKMKTDSSGKTQAPGQYQIGIRTKLTESGGRKQVKITFSDNGCGVPDEIRDKLFDPFFTTKEVGKGTGLGLSICHGIIEKHQGKITYESRVNEGSEFTITIPV